MAFRIPLLGRHGRGRYALVDAEDVELVAGHHWHVNAGYAVCWRNHGPNEPRPLPMHRLILRPAEGFQTDHINRDRLDNRRSKRYDVLDRSAAHVFGHRGAPLRAPRARFDAHAASPPGRGRRRGAGSGRRPGRRRRGARVIGSTAAAASPGGVYPCLLCEHNERTFAAIERHALAEHPHRAVRIQQTGLIP